MTGAETAIPQIRVLGRTNAERTHAPPRERWIAGTLIMGPKPPVQATTGFQGVSNPRSYTRFPPLATSRGQWLASSNMANSLAPAFRVKRDDPKPNPNSHNFHRDQPFMHAYGPSVRKGNTAKPESATFAMGGGQVVNIRKTGMVQYTRSM